MGNLICSKCQIPLEPANIEIDYLGYHFDNEKVPRCPKCGLIYISEELVKGKITLLETSLEDK
ncbi:MAG: DVU_1557 family redox protein [Pelotomaculum sp.]|jgi:hypothetical protein